MEELGWTRGSLGSVQSFSQGAIFPLPSLLLPPQLPLSGSSVQEVAVSLWGAQDREANNSREERKVWGGECYKTGPGRGWTDGSPLLLPPGFCKQPDLPLLSQPCLPSPRKQAACARVNTIQVINCLQQLAPELGPADT